MKLRARRSVSKYKRLSFGLAALMLVVQPMQGVIADRVASAVSDPNRPHVKLVSRTSDSVTIDFVNPTQNEFTFDYRVDGEASVGYRSELGDLAIKEGPLAGQPFNPRWHEVQPEKGSSIQKTINATEKVEVRLAHGAEQKWYFDWQTFNVLLGAPTGLKTITPTSANIDVTNGFTKVNYIRNSWNPVEGATSYNYEFMKPVGLPTYSRNITNTQIEGEFHNASSPNGLYGFRVQAVDGDGVVGEWSDLSSVTYDTTPPEINHVAPLAGTTIGRVASFEFETTDLLSGVRNVNLHLMQGNDTKRIVELKQDGSTKRWYAANVDLNSLANGEYAIVSRSTDKVGNTQFVNSNHGKITLDKTRPTVALVTPATTVVKGKLNVQVDANDDVRGLQSITANIYKDGTLVKSSSSSVSGTSASHSATFDLPDGTYAVRYNARNSLGNISETKNFTVNIDNTAPKVSNIRYEKIINGNIGGEFKIIVDAEDIHSDVKLDKKYTWARVHLGDKEWSYAFSKVEGEEKTYEATINTFDFVKVNNFAPGANITLRFADSLLNGSSAKPKDIQDIGVDNSGPDYKDSNVKTGDFIGIDSSKVFTVNFHDHTGVKSAGLTLINSNTGKQEGVTLSQNDDGSWSGDMSAVFAKLGDGVYNTNIRPVDLFGRPRSNTSSVKNVTVDTAKPTLKLNLNRKTYATPGDVVGAVQNPELEAFDTNFDRIVLYRADGTPTGNVWADAYDGKNRRAQVGFLKEGAYYAVAFDKAGNQSEEFHFTVDKTAPVASINVQSPAGTGDLHRDTVHVTGVVDSTELNMKSHWFEITNPDGSLSYSLDFTTSKLTYSFDLDTSKGDGQYKIRYVATDKAGNRNDDPNYSDPTIRTITVDNTAPEININSFVGDKTLGIFSELSLGYYDINKVAYAQFNDGKIHDFGDAVWSNTDAVWANRSWTGVTEGLNKVDLYDVAGNKSSFTFTIDADAPATPIIGGFTQNDDDRTILNVPSGSLVNTNGTSPNSTHMLWNKKDYNLDHIQAIRYSYKLPGAEVFKLGGVVKKSEQPQNFHTAWVGGVFSKHGDSEYQFKVQIQGVNGLWSDLSSPVSLTYDSTDPETTIIVSEIKDGKFTISGEAKDNLALKEVYVELFNKDTNTKVDDGITRDLTLQNDWSITYDITELLEGNYAAHAIVYDMAGNRGETEWTAIFSIVKETTEEEDIHNPEDVIPEATENILENTLPVNNQNTSTVNISEQPAVLGAQTDNGNSSTNDDNADSTKSEETDKENSEVLADQDDKTSWSAVNAILSGVTAIMGAITLFGFFTTSSEDRRTGLRAISVIIGIGAVVALLMIEDFSLKMGFVNIWTTLFALAAIVQAIMLANIREADEG